MASVSNSLLLTRNPGGAQLTPGSALKPFDIGLQSAAPTKMSFTPGCSRKLNLTTSRRPLTVQAAYSDGGRPSSASNFVGGFVLGGLIAGALGFVYAPQISRALYNTDKKDLMRKLPKFIYDEEKAVEKTRKVLTEKIAQLSSAIDDVSTHLHSEDSPNGVAVNSDEIEAAV